MHTIIHLLNGASLSEPHTSGTVLQKKTSQLVNSILSISSSSWQVPEFYQETTCEIIMEVKTGFFIMDCIMDLILNLILD